MAETESALRCFACPDEGLDDELFSAIVATRARRSLELFLERFGDHLDRSAPGLRHEIERFRDEPRDDPSVSWNLSQGWIFRAVRSGSVEEAVHAAAALGVLLAASGRKTSFAVELNKPSTFFFGDRLLPSASWIEVQAKGRAARIRGRHDRQRWCVQLEREGAMWRGRGAKKLLGFTDGKRQIVILTRSALPRDLMGDTFEQSADANDAHAAMMLRRAVRALREHAPGYADWVFRVLRHLALYPRVGSSIRSGTTADDHGLSYVSAFHNPAAMAEMMVHESCHHYLHVVEWLGKLHDGSDTRLYWSPVVKRERPLDRILLAYHAFANLVLMFRQFSSAGYDPYGYCQESEREVHAQVADMDAPLRDNPALTAAGRALYEPLRDRLA